jgi:hypothetical protein
MVINKFLAPSKTALARIAKQVIRAAKEDAFSKDDAKIVLEISAEMDTTNPKLLKGMQRRLKEIYIRNFRTLRDSLRASKKNKQSEEAKESTKNEAISKQPVRKANTLGPRVRIPLRA